MTTDTRALRALLDAGTPGEWELALSNESGRYISGHNGYVAIVHYWSRPEPEMQANAALIVALHNAARPLLDAADERDALRALLAEIRGDCETVYGVTAHNYRDFCLRGAAGTMPSDTWARHCQRRIEQIDDALTGAAKCP
jgi:hypothetical protein